MAWSNDFLINLGTGSVAPFYTLTWVKTPAGTLRQFGGNLRLSSFETQGYANIISIADSMFSGGDLRVRDGTTTPLMFSIAIVGNSQQMTDQLRIIQRGQVVALSVGFDRDPTTFETVALATIVGISRNGAGWMINCRGLDGSLSSRVTIEAGESTLGWDLASDTLAASVAGAATFIDVTDASDFRTDGQGVGAVQITADDGSTYYATYTSITAGGGAGGSDRLNGATVATFGSTHSATANGNTITEVMYTSAHPLKVIRRILTSTGLGTNGPDDILPESWGMGIPTEYVAERDIQQHIDLTQPASGTAAWHWVQPTAIDDPQVAIQQWAGGGGFFVTQHRGDLTARALLRPWLTQSPAHFVLTDDMIVPDSIQYEAWDPDFPVEYTRARMYYGDGTFNADGSDSETDHIPARVFNGHTMGGIYSDSSNETAITTEVINRIGHWDIRVPEKLSFQLRGWWPGQASVGETCDLQVTLLVSRDGSSFVGRRALVTRCSPDWFGATTEIELVVLPVDEWVVWAPGRV